MSTDVPHLEIEVDQLAVYMFRTNLLQNPKWIQLQISGLENPKDLFCLFLDLFFKGIVIVYGVDNRVYIDELGQEQFQVIAKCMHMAGIQCHLDMTPDQKEDDAAEALESASAVAKNTKCIIDSMNSISSLPDNLNINDYSFSLRIANTLCRLSFSIFAIP